METIGYGTNWIDVALWIWFALTAVSIAFVAWDLFTRTPEMRVMKWGWILVTLYTGIVGLVVYWFSCREPAPGTHEKFIAPLWKQAVGSTIHCMAGDATGIIVAAAITSLLGLPMGIDAVIEYFAGFAFGLFIFQALFMKDMLGGSYWEAVKSTFLPEWLSMNAVMAGMIPVMIILMTGDMRAMEPRNVRFWGIMSLASLVGAVLAYPVNLWLVAKKLKHGMGTERALGKGGADVNVERERLAGVEPSEATFNKDKIQPAHDMSAMNMKAMPEMKSDKAEISHSDGNHDAPANEMSGMNMGGNVSTASKIVVTLITIVMLAAGVWLAGRYGDFSMRTGNAMDEMPMNNMNH
ncbi:MAG: DUF4396 domain-containing protein [Acidobacteriota bacterium]|nr:DUF4396 domain-containing protein [Acidobacteriota bacterium]